MKNQVGFGKGRYGACLGDYDHDGLPDILIVSRDGVPFLYQNLGEGKFKNVLRRSGSFGYISKSGGICCQTIDINNDGRQDIFVTYDAGLAPQIFFNRGFRCFGLARKMDSQLQGLLPQAAGRTAGRLRGRFHRPQRDGHVPRSGQRRTVAGATKRGRRRRWPWSRRCRPRAPAPVPSSCTAFDQNQRPLGGWTVSAGEPGAFFGMTEMGPLTLKWRWPGGPVQEKEVIVEGKAIRLVLDKK